MRAELLPNAVCSRRRLLRSLLKGSTSLDIVTPTTTDPISFALSPDGRQIVYVASGDGASRHLSGMGSYVIGL
jgi:hypothetical protein